MLNDINSKERINIDSILEDILENKQVNRMNDYIQHYDITCFDHCYSVAKVTYKICKFFHLNYTEATRAAMLHDMFLYDWRIKSSSRKSLHGFYHPRVALENAEKEFNLTDKEKDIILKHMWPLTIIPPKSIEGFVVTISDKYVTLMEALIHYQKSHLLRHAYILWAIILFKF